jgi:hypothetical protein
MELDNTPLHEPDESPGAVGAEVQRTAFALLHFDSGDRGGDTWIGVLLVETLL